ncbi:MAG: hypothetical protein EAZ16_09870 [Sphingobacteriales bacterium]|jgi:hypothetical protein|nr:MAG: hypothetical protein EAZ16_09870 [Sphingobacteriales bacterium]
MKAMKRYLLLVLFFLGTGLGLLAQDDKPKNEDANRLEALKVAFLTRKLNLTTEEAQRFWPVYNRYMMEIKQARRENKGDELAYEERVVNIRKKFKGEFGGTLNAERVNQFFKADKEFGSYIQRELQERRIQRQNQVRKGVRQ